MIWYKCISYFKVKEFSVKMVMVKLKKLIGKHYLIVTFVLITTLYVAGFFAHLFQTSFNNFVYPLQEDISSYIDELKEHRRPSKDPINLYEYVYLKNPKHKCEGDVNLRLVFIVKSAMDHFERRAAIRRTWGYEKRFSDVEIRTFFTLGTGDDVKLQEEIDKEYSKHYDIIQSNFLDQYFNNTIKTMMSFRWVVNYCSRAMYYMFADDDFYISTKNVLKYIRNPVNYPNSHSLLNDIETPREGVRFYSGNCLPATPMRNLFSKWYISLKEYPYDSYPLYAIAGAYILSFDALVDLYYASYYTKHFRFDDVYLGIIAHKIGILPYHTKHIKTGKLSNNIEERRHLIALHGFDDSCVMEMFWRQQKELGYA